MFRPHIVKTTKCNLQQACEYLLYGWRPMREQDEKYDIRNNRKSIRPRYPFETDEYFVQARVLCQALLENVISLYRETDNGELQAIEIDNSEFTSILVDIYELEENRLLDFDRILSKRNLFFYYNDLRKIKNYKTFGIDNVYDIYIIGNCIFLERPDASLLCVRVLKNFPVDIILRYIIEKKPDCAVDLNHINQNSNEKKINIQETRIRNLFNEFFEQAKKYSPGLTEEDIEALKKFFIYERKTFKFVSDPEMSESENQTEF